MCNKTNFRLSKQAIFKYFLKPNRNHKLFLFFSSITRQYRKLKNTLFLFVSFFTALGSAYTTLCLCAFVPILFFCFVPSSVLSIQPFPPCTDTKENCQPTKVKIVSPKSGSTISGIVEIIPTVVDPIFPLERYEIEYYIDQKLKMKAYIIEPPYKWNTIRYPNGKHTITLNVCNRTGIVGYAATTVYVKN